MSAKTSRPITLKDIARETGVHVSTVSRALDAKGRDSLTEEVVAKVRETANRLGYRPNRLAAGLRTRRTRIVGLIIPDINNPLFPPIVRGIESVLEPLGYVSIIVNTDGRRDRERSQMRVLLEHGVDGIIHAAIERMDPYFEDSQAYNVPLITVNRGLDGDGVPAVVSDDAAGIDAMVRLLHEAGHRRIAHIAGPQQISTGIARLTAFRDSTKALGLEVPEFYIARSDRFNADEGYRCAEGLLSLARPPTGIVAANDGLALGTIRAIQAHGLACPRDHSVTGFNDHDVLEHIPPGLTTVRVDKAGIGQTCASLLIRMIENPDEQVPHRTIQPVEVVLRGSVAPPPA